ncbi:unnamed protein product, partial [Allacma fusca]
MQQNATDPIISSKGTIPNCFSKMTQKLADGDLDHMLVEFIIMTDQPFTIVEDESFLN